MKTQYDFSDSIALAVACAHAIIHKDKEWHGWLSSDPDNFDEEKKLEMSLGLTRLFNRTKKLISDYDPLLGRTACLVIEKVEASEIVRDNDTDGDLFDGRTIDITLSNNHAEKGKEMRITIFLRNYGEGRIDEIRWFKDKTPMFLEL